MVQLCVLGGGGRVLDEEINLIPAAEEPVHKSIDPGDARGWGARTETHTPSQQRTARTGAAAAAVGRAWLTSS